MQIFYSLKQKPTSFLQPLKNEVIKWKEHWNRSRCFGTNFIWNVIVKLSPNGIAFCVSPKYITYNELSLKSSQSIGCHYRIFIYGDREHGGEPPNFGNRFLWLPPIIINFQSQLWNFYKMDRALTISVRRFEMNTMYIVLNSWVHLFESLSNLYENTNYWKFP